MNWRAALSRRSFLAAAGLAACAPIAEPPSQEEQTGLGALAAAKGLHFGAALQPRHLRDEGYAALVRRETGMLVGESAQKWHIIAPDRATRDYTDADALAAFADVNGLVLRGHTLLWYLRMPGWWEAIEDRRAAEQAIADHIAATVGRYRGRIVSWDVVNEAIEVDDGRRDGLRRAVLLDRFGDGYLHRAFVAARQADPACQLVYNDYGFEYATRWHEQRRVALLGLLARFRRDRTPVDAVGLQSHLVAGQPFDAALWRRFLANIAAMNYRIVVTELDVADQALPSDAATRDAGVAAEYKRFLDATLDERAVDAVLTWGLTDRWTWIRGPGALPAHRRTDGMQQRPLPFDDALRRKPASTAIAQAFAAAPTRPRA